MLASGERTVQRFVLFSEDRRLNGRSYTDGNNPVGRENMLSPERKERAGKRTPLGGQEVSGTCTGGGFPLGRSIHEAPGGA